MNVGRLIECCSASEAKPKRTTAGRWSVGKLKAVWRLKGLMNRNRAIAQQVGQPERRAARFLSSSRFGRRRVTLDVGRQEHDEVRRWGRESGGVLISSTRGPQRVSSRSIRIRNDCAKTSNDPMSDQRSRSRIWTVCIRANNRGDRTKMRDIRAKNHGIRHKNRKIRRLFDDSLT